MYNIIDRPRYRYGSGVHRGPVPGSAVSCQQPPSVYTLAVGIPHPAAPISFVRGGKPQLRTKGVIVSRPR